MWARVARFEGDAASVEQRIERLQGLFDSGGLPPELDDATFLLLVDRESGGMIGVTLFPDEESLREGDALMNQGAGHAGSRSGVEFYEVPVSRFPSTR